MNLNELWRLYEADKRILGFSPKTLRAYALQHRLLMLELANLDRTKGYVNNAGGVLGKTSRSFEAKRPWPSNSVCSFSFPLRL